MKTVFIILLFIITSSIPLMSQSECDSVFFDVVLESQDLNEFCELNTGMPFEVLLSYIAFDSLCTSSNYNDWINFLENQNTFNDTLKTIYKFLYKTVDYNPVLFDKNKRFTNVDFNIHPMSILRNLEDKLELVSNNPMLDKALLFSSYILKIKIDTIINKIDPLSYDGNTITFVKATIIDTIKGKIAPLNYYFNSSFPNAFTSSNDRTQATQILNINSKLEFGYSPQWRVGNYIDSRLDTDKLLIDSTGDSWIKIDDEYLVFLQTFEVCRDSSTFFTTIRPLGLESSTFTMYPIKNNGSVYNPGNDFGLGTIDIQLFINAIRSRIQYLTN